MTESSPPSFSPRTLPPGSQRALCGSEHLVITSEEEAWSWYICAGQRQAYGSAFAWPWQQLILKTVPTKTFLYTCFFPRNNDVGLFSLSRWEIKLNNSAERVNGLPQIMRKGRTRRLSAKPYARANLAHTVLTLDPTVPKGVPHGKKWYCSHPCGPIFYKGAGVQLSPFCGSVGGCVRLAQVGGVCTNFWKLGI